MNLSHPFRNLRPAKGVFALRKQFGGALRFSEVFCFQEGGARAGFVLERFSGKPDKIIFTTQGCGNRCEEIIRQAFRFAQCFLVPPFQKKNVQSPAGNSEFLLVIHRDRFHRLKRSFRDAQIAFFGDGQLGFDLPKSETAWIYFEPAVDRFVSCIEIAQRLVTESEILKHPTVFRIETGCFSRLALDSGHFPRRRWIDPSAR